MKHSPIAAPGPSTLRSATLVAATTLLAALLVCAPSATAQQEKLPEGPPRAWVQAAADNELSIIANEDALPLRFQQRKIDAKGDTTRELIETRDGNVARLIERDGQPITAAEDAAERQRLQDEIAAPDDFHRHHRRDASSRDYAMQLVKLLPSAMLYTYVPGQPQPPGGNGRQVVVDFHPDPAFHPPTMLADVLTGIEGRAWIDAQAHRVTRIEARILHPVNFGFGIVAKIFPGGTLVFEQVDAGNGRWVYRHLEEHLTIRELMVKTVPQNVQMTSSGFRPMPALLPYQDAIRLLLAMPIPLR